MNGPRKKSPDQLGTLDVLAALGVAVQQALGHTHRVAQNGKTKKMTATEVIGARLVRDAMSGDLKALDRLSRLLKEVPLPKHQPISEIILTAIDPLHHPDSVHYIGLPGTPIPEDHPSRSLEARRRAGRNLGLPGLAPDITHVPFPPGHVKADEVIPEPPQLPAPGVPPAAGPEATPQEPATNPEPSAAPPKSIATPQPQGMPLAEPPADDWRDPSAGRGGPVEKPGPNYYHPTFTDRSWRRKEPGEGENS
jgi:hypothetical protein